MFEALLIATFATLSATKPAVKLLWSDAEGALPWGAEAVEREVRSIFADMGVGVVWQRYRDASPDLEVQPGAILVVVRPADSSRYGLPDRTMGVVLGDEPHETVFVFYRNVVDTLGYQAPHSTRQRDAINRALARVIAHEVVHALLGDGRHDRRGLLRRHLDREVLLEHRLTLSRRTSRAVKRRLENR